MAAEEADKGDLKYHASVSLVVVVIVSAIVFPIVVVVNKKIFFRLMTDSSLSTAPM